MGIARLAPLLVVAACAEPKQYEGPIAIVPGAAAIATERMGRGGAVDAGAGSLPPGAPRATVHTMRADEVLGGPNATGKAGDLLLSNGEVAFVVAHGDLVDAADARVRKDELGELSASLGGPTRRADNTDTTSGEAPDGSAWIEAKGHDPIEPALAVTTRYALAAPDRALLVTTTITNGADHAIAALVFGDAVEWGSATVIAPGKPLGFSGASSGAYVGGIGQRVSYAIASTDGDIRATSGASSTQTAQSDAISMAPGATATYARILAVGRRGDLASLVAELVEAAGQPIGEIAITLVGDDGKPMPAPAGAKIVFSNARGQEALWMRTAGAGDPLGGEVPPGLYLLSYAADGGLKGHGGATRVEIEAGKVARVQIAVTKSAP